MTYFPIQGLVLKEIWSLLGDHEALIAESSFTFNFPAVTFDDDSYLLLVIDGSINAALVLQIRINGDATASYFINGTRISTGVQTLITANFQNEGTLISAASLAFAGFSFGGQVTITVDKNATVNSPVINSMFGVDGSSIDRVGTIFNVNTPSITSIEIRTSSSTWRIGTRMTLYKVSRS